MGDPPAPTTEAAPANSTASNTDAEAAAAAAAAAEGSSVAEPQEGKQADEGLEPPAKNTQEALLHLLNHKDKNADVRLILF